MIKSKLLRACEQSSLKRCYAEPAAKSSALTINKPSKLTKLSKAMLICGFVGVLSPRAFAQQVDSAAPVLENMVISPTTVNTSDGSKAVNIQLVFSDTNTVSTNNFFLENLATGERIFVNQVGTWTSSGTRHSGEFTATISSGEDAGLWHLSGLVPTDAIGNASDAYDTLDELIVAQVQPFVSHAQVANQVDFDARLQAVAAFTQTGSTQTSQLNVRLEDAVEYELWFVPYAGTRLNSISFSGAISLAQSCLILDDYAKCVVTSSNNNQDILATVNTSAGNIDIFGYSTLAQPTALEFEANWLNNYVEFPLQDFDIDGIPNEQDEDDDNDGVNDIDDLFPLNASETIDFDGDGIGDNADTDDDNDGVPDAQDVFPFDPSENSDNDNDGLGNNADLDDDNDGVLDSSDAFPFDATESLDSDLDGIGNNADNDDDNDGGTDDNDAFPLDPNETIDSDGDGIGNNADTDDDNDGTLDVDDAFPRDPTEDTDTDEDGVGNNTDEDDDNDGVRDVDDIFPLDPGDFRDNDQDGIGDNTDSDDDNDGILDFEDAFPFNPNESRDNDGDGIGDNADLDDDNDGLDDVFDRFPFDASEVSDFDGDDIGNNADNDDDNDGVLDNVDAFPFAVGEWFDTDGDGIGNNADLDDDNDGLDDEFDAFPRDASETLDFDNDGIGDNADNDDDNDGVDDSADAFPFDANETLDTDKDGVGNNADTDDDGDRVLDVDDLFPLDRTEWADNDLDGVGNNEDNDDDNDGVLDSDDAFPFDVSESLDNDADGVGDNADLDDDNDNFPDAEDAFPFDSSEWIDSDEDGAGNNRDTDDDNDGVLDEQDAFPLDSTETLDNDNDGVGNNTDEDDDNDGVLDTVDAFPFSEDESVDSDGDGIGNNADSDDDNDGIVDDDDIQPLNPSIGDSQAPVIDGIEDFSIEATGPTTPIILEEPRVRDDNLNPATLSNDFSGDLVLGDNAITWTAVDFAGNKSTLVQIVTVVDTTAPEFPIIDAIDITARGFLTDVSQDIDLSAADLVDGSVQAVLVTENNLRAGQRSVIMSATDAAGNVALTEVFLNLQPSVVVKPSAVAGPGNRVELPLSLTGKASEYPVTLNYSIAGPIISQAMGTIVINEGQQGMLQLDVAPTANLGQQIFVSFSGGVNASTELTPQVIIDIDTSNQQPLAGIVTRQNNEPVNVVYQDQGLVNLSVQINDINLSDSHRVEWRFTSADDGSDISLTDVNDDLLANTFEFDPTSLTEGIYTLSVAVTENDTLESLSVTVDTPMVILALKPALSANIDSDFDGISDLLEGLFDSDGDGIANYLDDNDNTANLPSGVSEQPLSTLAGYRLSIGDVARMAKQATATAANIRIQDIADFGGVNGSPAESVTDIHYSPVQAIQSFNIEGLDYAGQSLPVVIPLSTGTRIPANADYRKFSARDGWFSFVVNRSNSISTANLDADGNCPEPLSDDYTPGLNEGDSCIQLLIQDGGPNDADLLANGVIKDPGVLAIELPNRAPLISVAQQTSVVEGELVRVDASLSSDFEEDELTFRWTQTGGAPIVLGENTSPLLSFLAPQVDGDQSLSFTLDVFDGRATSSSNITVLVRNINSAPQVSINTHSATVEENQRISVSATVSDSDSDALRIEWQQVSGPSVVLSNADSAEVSFIAPSVEQNATVELRVIVSDGSKEVAASTRISVLNSEAVSSPTPTSDGGESGGGSISVFLLFVAILTALLRRTGLASVQTNKGPAEQSALGGVYTLARGNETPYKPLRLGSHYVPPINLSE